jgi:hypothetical protein
MIQKMADKLAFANTIPGTPQAMSLQSSQLLMKLKFSLQIFGRKSQISNFIKIRLVEGEFFHADRQMEAHT